MIYGYLSLAVRFADLIEYQTPEEIVVSQKKGSSLAKLEAFETQDWAETTMQFARQDLGVSISASHWIFTDWFYKTTERLPVALTKAVAGETAEFNIRDLELYPLRYATPEVKEALRKRGRMFWRCRHRNYIRYNANDDDVIQNSVS
jgi:hypothetical protein